MSLFEQGTMPAFSILLSQWKQTVHRQPVSKEVHMLSVLDMSVWIEQVNFRESKSKQDEYRDYRKKWTYQVF